MIPIYVDHFIQYSTSRDTPYLSDPPSLYCRDGHYVRCKDAQQHLKHEEGIVHGRIPSQNVLRGVSNASSIEVVGANPPGDPQIRPP